MVQPGISQTPRLRHCVYVLGNLTDIEDKGAYAKDLRRELSNINRTTVLLINGDLVSPMKQSLNEGLSELNIFLRELEDLPIRIIIIPGDRDWDRGRQNGWDKVQLIEDYVAQQNYANVEWPIRRGCPGPELVHIAEDFKIIAINTQWWNHRFLKPTPESAVCDIASEGAFIEELENLIEENTLGNLIIAGHYPIQSNGKYGGRFPLKDWLLPVPIISSYKTAFRQNIGHSREIANAQFESLRHDLTDIFADHFSITYCSGHEQNQEILQVGKNIYVNSGAPDDEGYVANSRQTVYKSKKAGIVALFYDSDGAVYGSHLEKLEKGFQKHDDVLLFQAPCKDPIPVTPVNERLVPCAEAAEILPQMVNFYPALANQVANPNYAAKGWKRTFLGQHYRDSWTTEVRIPVLNLDQELNGLRPFQVGGGRQTTTLKLAADNGLEYAFRSVDKDPSKSLQVELRSTLLSVVLKDQTTTQQPYGALTASYLLDHLDILHAQPRLYIMPDDPKLGPFQETFGNMMGFLEERPTSPPPGETGHFGENDVKRSIKMFRQMYKDRDNYIEVEEFTRARLFDILVGDWGKHEDNWKWAGYNYEKGIRYRPIPRDRDHVFSLWDGFFPWLADRKWANASGESFRYEINDIRSLTWQSRHMDRYLLSEVDRDGWMQAAKEIKGKLSDEIIEEGVKRMPEEIYEKDGIEIEEKLKVRLNDLDKYADEYYRLIAKEVDVVGSVKEELFEVNRLAGGDVSVEMYKIKQGQKDKLFYRRLFKSDETREIRLFGLQGNDRYKIQGESDKSILLRVVPGTGLDSIVDESNVRIGGRKTLVYDETYSDALIKSKETKLVKTDNHDAYHYRRTDFHYNTYFPLFFLYFSGDNGLSLRGDLQFTNHKYGKPDFSSMHDAKFSISTIGNIQLEYDVKWRQVIANWDLTAGAQWEKKRQFRYFFGEGNDSKFDPALILSKFYTLQYSSIQARVGMQNNYWKRSHTFAGLSIERNSSELNDGTILDEEGLDVLGEDPLIIAKAKFRFEFDFRDKRILPRRGMRLHSKSTLGQLLDGPQSTYLTSAAELEYFGTTRPFTIGLRIGAVWHVGDIPYYDRAYLGQNSNLRGFRRNRYTGEKLYYFNSDIRIELLNKMSAIIPYQFGLKLFYDVGRPAIDDAESNSWRVGYGAGFYFVPVRERYVLNVLVGTSVEETGLLILSVGRNF